MPLPDCTGTLLLPLRLTVDPTCRTPTNRINGDCHPRPSTPEKVLLTVPLSTLAGANLSGQIIRNANLQNADLRGANFEKANLHSALLENADLSGANLSEAVLTGAHANGARFIQANLANACMNCFPLMMKYASFTRADFSGANLCGVDLGGTDLTGANLAGANLTGADLRGTNLTGVNLANARVMEVEYDVNTRWPVGFRPGPSVQSWPSKKIELERSLEDSQESVSYSPSGKKVDSESSDGCYVATACYGSYDHADVRVLRSFRDECLLSHPLGQAFVFLYYRLSPALVRHMSRGVGKACRSWLLEPLVAHLRKREAHR